MQWGAAALLTVLAAHLAITPMVVRFPITTVFLSTVLVLLLLQAIGIVGSLLGWRWMFYAVAAYFLFVSASAARSLPALVAGPPPGANFPLLVSEQALGLIPAGFVIWMFIAYRKFGPWAMRERDDVD